ncbi:MAG: hypothetical protein ACK55Z_01155, partial [bacterium]
MSTIKVGPKLTAFDKFVQILRKFLDIDPQYESALDKIARLTDEVISPSFAPTKKEIDARPWRGSAVSPEIPQQTSEDVVEDTKAKLQQKLQRRTPP